MWYRSRNTGKTMAAALNIYRSLMLGKNCSVQGENDDFVVKVKNIIWEMFGRELEIDIIFFDETERGKLEALFTKNHIDKLNDLYRMALGKDFVEPPPKVVGYTLTLKPI